MRRGNFDDDTVDYAAVGATQASDLMQYPPEKSIPAEASWRIGSGEARFTSAGEALLAWTAQRVAGLEVGDVRPAPGPNYSGIAFDEDGKPILPSQREKDQRFDGDGTPYVSSGMSARLTGRVGGLNASSRCRVVFAIEEPRRVGFALGTLGDSVVSGEELFLVERHHNDEVWFTVRAFDTPTSFLYRLLPGLVRRRRQKLFQQYLRAVSPMYATSS